MRYPDESKKEWSVQGPQGAMDTLAKSFKDGPIIDDQCRRYLTEELVAHLNGLKIEIFANEHPPPHFRVKYAGDTENFAIEDCSKLNGGLNKWRRNIEKWHRDNKKLLIDTWNRTRPSDCPVGKYRGHT